ncbi:MAG: penicillin-binding transpeptidase domain-containing protein [Lachnospiraceae bacterium]|nr:penicillin-binding transpeptidase domain-containing protein [Lachnospiraceae bacterium]
MRNCKTAQKQRIFFVFVIVILCSFLLSARLVYLMVIKADHYAKKAKEVQQRERAIKAERGKIYDRNGILIAANKPVSTISVIHNQIKDKETVIRNLSVLLDVDEEKVRKRVEKKSSREKIKSNVEKNISDQIRKLNMAGVMVDEDYKRYYPYGSLASKVIGFAGGDNQGILGLEAKYDSMLAGQDGSILTSTNARGIEIEGAVENRIEPVAGNDLYCSLDVNLQKFAQQEADKVMKAKKAKNVRIIMMNPQDGQIYAMVNLPEFDLNNPYKTDQKKQLSEKETQDYLNQKWRNHCVSDTYEPGSTFKVITAASALEAGVVKLNDTFQCPGYKVVEDRRIRCHKTTGHGTETFVQGVQNSCNPVFMEVGARLGTERLFQYLQKFGVLEKTGIDLSGEAATIMHQKKNVGAVELATMTFGQSFQLTPLRLLTSVSAVINGGRLVTPHVGVCMENTQQSYVRKLKYKEKADVLSSQTSETMKEILASVVSEGSGKKAAVSGYDVGAKTGTSEKLPRSSNKYIASTLGFAPAKNPIVLAIVLIDEPEGIYYGGQIAAPVISKLLDNALPYLGAKRSVQKKK